MILYTCNSFLHISTYKNSVEYCDYLSIPIGGMISDNCTYHYGSVCYYSCDEGHRLIGSNSRICDSDADGQLTWLGERPTCERND